MQKITLYLCLLILCSCSKNFDPRNTFTTEQIRSDYALMRQALTEAHPGVYRYTSPDSIRWIFDKVEKQLDHAMTEREFRRITNPVFAMIRCGHTDIYASNGYLKYAKKHPQKDLPFSTNFLEGKIRITQNMSTDSTLKIGDEIVQIDNRTIAEIIAQMRETMSSDGYNQTFKTTLINQGFDSYYRFLYGQPDSLKVVVRDSSQQLKTLNLKLKKPSKGIAKKDTTTKIALKPPKISKADLKRTLKFSNNDSSLAILDINTFSDGSHKSFYKRAFRQIQEKGIKHLVIDLRNNGGGHSDASIKLMSYLLDSNFVVYDSVYSPIRKPTINRYYRWKFIRFISRNFLSRSLPNGGILHRATGKVQKPTSKYHFDGNTYILTNGRTFSAASIFASMAQLHQKKAVVIGRETGGGRYGCNAFIAPNIVLPNTQTRVRLPMYKLLLHIPGKDVGRGVMPDYPVDYTFKQAQAGIDEDMVKVYNLIKAGN